MKKIAAVIAISASLVGCAHVTPYVSSMNFSPEAMEVLGTGQGESRQGFVLCFLSLDETYSAMKAVESAISPVDPPTDDFHAA